MRNGAVGFVTKPYREQELLDNINEALARDAAVRSVATIDDRYQRRRAKACIGLAGIVQEADDRLTQEATDDARDPEYRFGRSLSHL